VVVFQLGIVLRFVDIATRELGDAREEIDALNVYPVPDGDTGTNMFLTMSAARDALREATGGSPTADLDPSLAAFSRGALLGARGNSGVILSQMLGAIAGRIARAAPDDRTAQVFAEAMQEATEASYAAVGTPVEGTILSVLRAASDACLAAAEDPTHRLRDVVEAGAAAARAALERTPEQLPTLRDAGVVDAGGRGLCVILDAAETALTGRRPVVPPTRLGVRHIPMPMPTNDLTPDGPAYEVMYLLDAEDTRIDDLKKTLAPLGDSLVVVGGGRLWNVHVHVDDVGAALEAGIVAGRPYRVRVTHFAEQIDAAARSRTPARSGRRIVAVAAGDGLRGLFEEAGAVVVPGGPGRRPSTGMLVDAIEACGAAEVVVLPNDPDSVRVAEIAARTAEESGQVRVAVIPSVAQVQGLAAIAVHEPGRSFDQDVLHMTATARHARHGAVTIAARRAITMAGPCEPGDVLGVIEGDFAVVGDDLFAVATDIIERLVGGGGELVTLVAGRDAGDLAERCGEYVESAHPTVDAVVYDGGQERYPLLVAVE
jgi:DAK2 domain fusion protein YloV